MKRVSIAAAAFMAAVVVLASFSAPPPRIHLPVAPSDGTIAGAIHVHSTYSDGVGTFDSIASAAADAGLTFVIVTDHGDGTRPPEEPAYLHGVLMMDGVEISTTDGHYIALGIHKAPYPLGGEGRDVAEDVARLGGFGVVAHPDSPKPALQWRDWDVAFDGVELVNLDTGWRHRVAQPGLAEKLGLAAAVAGSFVRPSEAIARLAAPGDAVSHWVAAAAKKQTVALAGADAHGGLTVGDDEGGMGIPVRLTGYEPAFRAMSVHVRADRALSGEPDTDAAAILRAIRAGHLYVAMNGLADPPSFEFTASQGDALAAEGDLLPPGAPLTLHIRSNAPAGFVTTVLNGTAVVGMPHAEPEFTLNVGGEPAFYRVTIHAPSPGTNEPGPLWLFSNPIYIRAPAPAPAVEAPAPATATTVLFRTVDSGQQWHTDSDPTSVAAVDAADVPSGAELRFRFGFPGGPRAQQFAALVYSTTTPIGGDRLVFEGRSAAPARVSVQFREAGGDTRWQRSVYLDEEWTPHSLELAGFRPPVGSTDAPARPSGPFGALMFVVDTTNTALGTSGRLWFRNIRLETVR